MREHTILVVAHPDDEVLWFSSILQRVGLIIIAFRDYDAVPGLGNRRAAAIAELPYANLVCLAIPEAGSLKLADWQNATVTESGLALLGSPAVQRRYETNFTTLKAQLADLLRGVTEVYTHNPWGEYGHEDHIQVHRAVENLSAAYGFQMWVPNYYGTRSEKLASRYRAPDVPARILPVDGPMAQDLAAIYERHDCWTWTHGWTWPREDVFLSGPFRLAGSTDVGPRRDLRFVQSEI